MAVVERVEREVVVEVGVPLEEEVSLGDLTWREKKRVAYGISGVDVPDVGVGGEMRAVGVGEREARGAVVVSIWEVVSAIVAVVAVVFFGGGVEEVDGEVKCMGLFSG